MKSKKSFRKFLLIAGMILLVIGALVAAFPYWISLALRPATRHFGLTYSTYERIGYNRFALNSADYKSSSFEFKAKRIEGFLPVSWWWNSRKNGLTNPPAYVAVNGWQLKMSGASSTNTLPDGHSAPSVDRTIRQIDSTLKSLRARVPKALLSNGRVTYQTREIDCTTLLWQDGKVTGDLVWPATATDVSLKGNFAGKNSDELSVHIDALDIRSRIWINIGSDGTSIRATNAWQKTDLALTAEFGPSGSVPEKAQLVSKSFRIPAELLKLSQYTELTGSLNGDWISNHFSVNLSGAASPLEPTNGFSPPVELQLGAEGTPQLATLHRFKVTSPGLILELSKPAEFDFSGNLHGSPAELRLGLDLSKLPGNMATGQVSGIVAAIPSTNRFPHCDFSITGTNISAFKLAATSASLEGSLAWPIVAIKTLDWRESKNSTASFSGLIDLEKKIVGNGKIGIQGDIGHQWLPPGYSFDSLSLTGEVSGPVTNLSHSGRMEILRLATPKTATLRVQSEWRGRQVNIEQFEARISGGPATVDVGAQVRAEGGETNVIVSKLTMQKGNETLMELAHPFSISFEASNSRTNKSPRVQVKDFQWRGSNRNLELSGDVQWPARAYLSASAQRFDLAVFQSFVTNSLEGAFFENLKLEGGWTNGPVFAQLEALLRVAGSAEDVFTADLKLKTSDQATDIERLSVSGESGEIVTAKGALPLILNPSATSRTNIVNFDQHKPLKLELTTTTNEWLWNRISGLLGVKLGSPRISVAVTGTPKAPQGHIDVSIDEVQYAKSKKPLPKIRKLEAVIRLNEKNAQLDKLAFLLDSQPISISGELPLGDEVWRDSRIDLKKHLWEKANLHLTATNVAIAPFVEYFPLALTPQGTAQVDLALVQGGNLRGTILLDGVTTRPFEPVGALENIHTALKLTNRVVRVVEFSSSLGGEPVSASGYFDFSDQALQTEMPWFEFKLKGENLPLVRQPELILRSDLNIVLTHTNTDQPLISGLVNLRDSFFLSDIRTLVPGRVARPSKRPPYFSIEAEPFAQWKLDVRARGNDFFHIKSPLFSGEVSANFRVEGNLKEPFASGEATINSGLVMFPFANVKVTQGLVSLTRDSPYRPQVLVNGSSRAFGYDIKMAIHGPADEPVIEFTSTPALSSEQIILMLTAGEMPHNEINFSNQQRASALAMFLGKSLWSKFSSGEGGAERLTVTSGEDVSETGKQTYALEYKLTDKWSIVGEYYRYSALNVGLKWKLYSR